VAVAHLPPTVSQLLLLQALFIADLRNELTLTLHHSLCLFRVLLDARPFCFLQYTALPACCSCSPFYLEFVWGGAPPPLSGECATLSHCWTPSPLQAQSGQWCHSHLLRLACLFTVCGKCPSPPLRWDYPHDSHC
jgi:hypothetical protein